MLLEVGSKVVEYWYVILMSDDQLHGGCYVPRKIFAGVDEAATQYNK